LIDKLKRIMENKRYKKIFIEFSEGFYDIALKIYKELSKYGDKRIFLNGDIRYGSCDIDYIFYERVKPDIIIHIGHTHHPDISKEIENKYEIIYLPCFIEKINRELLLKTKEHICNSSYKNILLISSLQYIPYLEKIEAMLQKNSCGKKIYTPSIPGLLKGQIIGCYNKYLRSYTKNANAVYVLSSGLFHVLGVGLYCNLPTYLVDLKRSEIIPIDKYIRKVKALIAWNIFRALEANKFCILASKNPIQEKISHLKSITKILKKHKRKFDIIYVQRIVPEALSMLLNTCDVYVTASCPRIAIDDITRFNKPILNFEQLLILFGYINFWDVYP